MKVPYAVTKRRPLILLISYLLGNSARGTKTAANRSIQKISRERICGSVTGIVFIKDVIPKTEAMLNMFEPIKFPKEMAFSFLAAAITDAANSGTLVPMAIIDTEITASLTPIS